MTRSLITGNAFIGSTVIGSIGREVVDPGLAHQPRLAVDLGAARAALGRLAVPADRQVGGLVALDLEHRVEHDHPVLELDVEIHQLAARSDRRARSAGGG